MQNLIACIVSTFFLFSASASAQEPLESRLLFPEDGAQGVSTNPSLLVEFRGALFVSPKRSLDLALVAQSDRGKLIYPPAITGGAFQIDASGTKRYRASLTGQMGWSDADGFDLQTEPLDLLPNTRYEIRSGVAGCAEGDTSLLCIADNAPIIGSFETGEGPDTTPPTARLTRFPDSPSDCESTLGVEGEDDSTPSRLIRYQQLGDSPIDLGFGPDLTIAARWSRNAPAVSTERIVAIDQSGNVGEPLEIELETCQGFDLSVLGDDTNARDGEGCSLGAGGPASSGGLWALALSALMLMRLSPRPHSRKLRPWTVVQRLRCGLPQSRKR